MPTRDDVRKSGPHGFDAAAATYDAQFTLTQLGELIRRATRRRLARFEPGARVLELGCGTGEDAVWLAQRGLHVTAVDVSEEMLATTARKAERHGVKLQVAQIDLRRPGRALQGQQFDAAFSNFGPLNCIRDRRQLGAWLAPLLPSGAPFVAVVMGPLCPWEWLWHGGHGDVKAATRRLRPAATAHAGGGGTVEVWYPTARTLRKELRPWFEHEHDVGVGFLLPTSDAHHVVDRFPRMFSALAIAEHRLESTLAARWLNDHYIATMHRR